jgi:hypothetical protein
LRPPTPLKVYQPRPASGRVLQVVGPSVIVVLFVCLVSGGEFAVPAASFVAAILLGGAVYLDVFSGRVWTYFYRDRLEIQGPVGHWLEALLGWRLGRATIPYQSIASLGCSESAGSAILGTAYFLVVHRRQRLWRRRFFIPCKSLDGYKDLMEELTKRLPQGCDLYRRKPFGGREPL